MQKEHRPKHKSPCKKKKRWLNYLHDEILFKQPEGSHYGDIAPSPLPLLIHQAPLRWHVAAI
eukprot:scaffold16250_cov84-Skeletonema_dohrnii-CCMP3373.AAC.2